MAKVLVSALLTIGVLLIGMSESAVAQDTGNDLLRELAGGHDIKGLVPGSCGDQINEAAVRSHSRGYIYGVANTLIGLDKICVNDGVINGQYIDVVEKYIKDNPATRHEYKLVLIYRALTDAWPCKEK